MTLAELSKQAEDLYNDFVDSYKDCTQNHGTNDLDDLIPDETIDEYEQIDDEIAHKPVGKFGHWDEQTQLIYWLVRGESGEYVHRLDNPTNGYSD